MKQILSLIICALVVCSCAATYPPAPSILSATQQPSDRLQPGDQIRVIVFGEDALSGGYTLDKNGALTLPLIGTVSVRDKTLDETATIIALALQKDYVRNPHVSVSFDHPRDIYVLGEVQRPGNYAYAPNLTVLQAVAKAGGYTYRAKNTDMLLRRLNPGQTNTLTKFQANEDTPLLPGDSLTVQERFF